MTGRGVFCTHLLLDRSRPAAKNAAGCFTLRADALKISEDYFEDYELLDDDDPAGAKYTASIEVPLVETMYPGTRYSIQRGGNRQNITH